MITIFRVVSMTAALLIILGAVAIGQPYTVPTVFVNVDEVEGLTPDGKIPDGGTIIIPIRFFNMDEARATIMNYYEVLTEDATLSGISAEWNPEYPWDWPHAIPLGIFPPYFDQGLFTFYDQNHVGMVGLVGPSGTGLPQDFDGIAYYVTISDISGPGGATLILDSLLCMEPCSEFTYWSWGGWWPYSTIPAWDGPYEFEIDGGPPPVVHTTCWPQPTVILRENDGLLNVIVHNEENDQVILESMRVQGKIPPYTEARIEFDSIVTDCLLTRFIGCSGWRPLSPEGIQDQYTVEYDKLDGSHVILTGDYVLSFVDWGDVNLDGAVDIADLQFMHEYFFNGGEACSYEEFMDVDNSGRIDIQDLRELIEITGL
ncbi:MAG: hypothetical protein JSU74_03020 [Candidatus Zixiibacteriota bacterium]|nr:MAG: hypothetical protein JSU74_03020 [candidate division Zixibacteria bacterium]